MVLQIVAQQCRQLLGLPESTAPEPAAGSDAVGVVWKADVGTDVMTATELSLVCLAREGGLVQRRVLALLRQLLHLAQEREDVLVPPQVAQAAHAAVAALREAEAAAGADCSTRLGLQLDALRSMTVSRKTVAMGRTQLQQLSSVQVRAVPGSCVTARQTRMCPSVGRLNSLAHTFRLKLEYSDMTVIVLRLPCGLSVWSRRALWLTRTCCHERTSRTYTV